MRRRKAELRAHLNSSGGGGGVFNFFQTTFEHFCVPSHQKLRTHSPQRGAALLQVLQLSKSPPSLGKGFDLHDAPSSNVWQQYHFNKASQAQLCDVAIQDKLKTMKRVVGR